MLRIASTGSGLLTSGRFSDRGSEEIDKKDSMNDSPLKSTFFLALTGIFHHIKFIKIVYLSQNVRHFRFTHRKLTTKTTAKKQFNELIRSIDNEIMN